jgi:2'-5' RNA ligase
MAAAADAKQQKGVCTSLCIIPPQEFWPQLQAVRVQHDRVVARWPPHINVLYPFVVESDFEAAVEPLTQALSTVKTFRVTLNDISLFKKGKNCQMFADPKVVSGTDTDALKQLYACVESVFPFCNDLGRKSADGFHAHLSLGQFKGLQRYEQARDALVENWKPIEFEVNQMYMISRDPNGQDPFHVRHVIPLGGASPDGKLVPVDYVYTQAAFDDVILAAVHVEEDMWPVNQAKARKLKRDQDSKQKQQQQQDSQAPVVPVPAAAAAATTTAATTSATTTDATIAINNELSAASDTEQNISDQFSSMQQLITSMEQVLVGTGMESQLSSKLDEAQARLAALTEKLHQSQALLQKRQQQVATLKQQTAASTATSNATANSPTVDGDNLEDDTVDDTKDAGESLPNTADQTHVKNAPFFFGGMERPVLIRNKSEDDPEPRNGEGVWLPKGYVPTVEDGMSEQERHNVKHRAWDSSHQMWVTRDVPLTDEELECWENQWKYLQCPITGRHWLSSSAILGVGVYHAPRFLSEDEKDRQRFVQKMVMKRRAIEDQKLEASIESAKAENADADANPTVTLTFDMPDTKFHDDDSDEESDALDGFSDGDVSDDDDDGDSDDALTMLQKAEQSDSKSKTHTIQMDGTSVDVQVSTENQHDDIHDDTVHTDIAGEQEYFQVYPRVSRPRPGTVRALGRLSTNTRVGKLQVIVPQVFDVRAYNDGANGNAEKNIQPMKERGVVDFDQQFNATNFQFFVTRGDGKHERKLCTNRLSFFIEEKHGSRIFPDNIVSQLGLIVYRDGRRLFRKKGSKAGRVNERMLARCIRLVIPRLLKSIIGELTSARTEAFDDRFDQVLRIYLLVHQVAIKLVKHYPSCFQYLYRKVFRWLQNPFARENRRTWPDIEEVLIAASLVGIDFSYIREAFTRKLVYTLLRNTSQMSANAEMHNRIRHMFNQNKAFIHRVLYEMSFFVAGGRNLFELDRVYTRCAGSLPRAERDRIRETVEEVRNVNSLEDFWRIMGMDSAVATDHEVRYHIGQFFKYLEQKANIWNKQELPGSADDITVPTFSDEKDYSKHADAEFSVAKLGLLGFRSAAEKEKAKYLAEERAKHQGLPLLDRSGGLSRRVCNYPRCGRKFNNRAHLMMHCRRVVPGFTDRMHISHRNLRQNEIPDFDSLRNQAGPYMCPAEHCDSKKCGFATVEELREHLRETGVRPLWNPTFARELENKIQLEIKKEQQDDAKSGNNSGTSVLMADPYDDPDSCVVCLDNERDVVINPCGHLCLCAECGGYLDECPICRTGIVGLLPVHYAHSKLKVYRS